MFSWLQSIWDTIEIIHTQLWTGISALFSLIPRAIAVTANAIVALPVPLTIFAFLAFFVGLNFLILKLVAMLL